MHSLSTWGWVSLAWPQVQDTLKAVFVPVSVVIFGIYHSRSGLKYFAYLISAEVAHVFSPFLWFPVSRVVFEVLNLGLFLSCLS